MKKLLAVFMGLFMVVACNKENETFKGFEYQMVDAPNGAKITLAFDKEAPRFMGKVINNYFGSYEADETNFKFGNAMSTMMAGAPELMQAEHEYLTALPEVESYKVTKDKLVLIKADGSEMVFNKIGEAKTK